MTEQEELRMLRERLGPRGLEVIEIDGAGHYVNEKVKAEIERLRAIVRVNGLRWGHTHAEIDALLAQPNGDR